MSMRRWKAVALAVSVIASTLGSLAGPASMAAAFWPGAVSSGGAVSLGWHVAVGAGDGAPAVVRPCGGRGRNRRGLWWSSDRAGWRSWGRPRGRAGRPGRGVVGRRAYRRLRPRWRQPAVADMDRLWRLSVVGMVEAGRRPRGVGLLPDRTSGRPAASTSSCWGPTAWSISGPGPVPAGARPGCPVGAPPPGAAAIGRRRRRGVPAGSTFSCGAGTTGCGRGSGPGPAGRAGSSLPAPRQGCWPRLPAPARGVPVCSTSAPPDCLVRGTDGHVYQTTWDGGWCPWSAVGSPHDVIVGAPGLVTTMQQRPYALRAGARTTAVTDSFPATRWPPWPPPPRRGPAAAGIAGFTVVDLATDEVDRAASPNADPHRVGHQGSHRHGPDRYRERRGAGLTAGEQAALRTDDHPIRQQRRHALWNEVGGDNVIDLMWAWVPPRPHPIRVAPGDSPRPPAVTSRSCWPGWPKACSAHQAPMRSFR